MSVQHALNGFLKQYLDDQSSGRRRALAEYQALFPGHEEVIAERFAQYESEEGEAGHEPALQLPGHIGPYRVLAELGRGSQGVVYLAEDERLHRKVAVKVLTGLGALTRDRMTRFLREAEVASRLHHPGIATVYEVGTDGAAPYLAMRYVEGETLAHRISAMRKGEVGRDQVLEIAGQIEKVARALHAAHESAVVHRDVKPGNILLPPSGDPVLVDFGLARDAEGALATLTRTGDFFGTPAYMSPEQISTEQAGPPDRRTDVWSLGASLYEWLTLRRAFEAPTREGLYQAILTKAPADPREANADIPRDLRLVLDTALEKDRDRRYQTALDFAEDLRRVRAREPILAKPVGQLVRLRRWSQRNPALAAALAALFLAMALGLTIALFLLDRAHRDRDARDVALGEKNAALGGLGAALADYDRLGDRTRLEQLILEADDIWPAEPWRVPAIREWIARATDLAGRLPGHVAALERLRRRGALAAPASHGADSRAAEAQPVWKFESITDQFKHDSTARLVADLEVLTDPDPAKGLLASMQKRLNFSERVEHDTLVAPAARWAEAIRSIADRTECPKYDGLRIKPQLGLVPIGRDEGSGLWEFSHLETTGLEADPIPTREAGRIMVAEGTGLVFVLLPGGTFSMGATKPADDDTPLSTPNVDPEAGPNEAPVNFVRLDPFFMSKYEMTQSQWWRVTRKRPSSYWPGSWFGGNEVTPVNPVEQVSWDECDVWLRRFGLVLPTEAQWEYAARGGTTTPRWTGLGKEGLASAANVADESFRGHVGLLGQQSEAWDDGYTVHAPVGSFRANPFGLHDVLGNVAEWCRDWQANYDHVASPGDGLRQSEVHRGRVFRGGSFRYDASFARSAFRLADLPDLRSSSRGVRPARVLDR